MEGINLFQGFVSSQPATVIPDAPVVSISPAIAAPGYQKKNWPKFQHGIDPVHDVSTNIHIVLYVNEYVYVNKTFNTCILNMCY